MLLSLLQALKILTFPAIITVLAFTTQGIKSRIYFSKNFVLPASLPDNDLYIRLPWELLPVLGPLERRRDANT